MALPSRTPARRRFGPVVGALALVAALWLARGPLTQALGFVQAPLSSLGIWARGQGAWLFEPETVSIGRVRELERERAAFAVERSELEALRGENARLRNLLSFRERQPRTTLSARILARDSGSRIERYVIDRGSDDGVEPGLAVVAGDGLLAGKVLEVGPSSSTVLAPSDPSFAAAVSLLNESRTIGVVEGRLGQLLSVRFIPAEIALALDDLVVTSGLEDRIPSGLVVGAVTAVRHEENAPFQEAVVEPLVDLRRETELSVVLMGRRL